MAEETAYIEFAVRAGVALLGGALIGLERERAQLAGKGGPKGASIPGLRSIGLVSLYGFLVSYASSYLQGSTGWVLMAVGSASIVLLVLIYSYARLVLARSGGVTTQLVLFTTFMIGVLSGFGLVLEAAGLSIVVGLLLASKDTVARLARSISYPELVAMMEVGALVVVIGPLVQALRPLIPVIDILQVYLFTVAVVGVVFTSYMAARVWGERGAAASIILGSLVNSEAVIAAIARAATAAKTASKTLVAAAATIVIAVMQIRSAVLAGYALFIAIGPPPAESLATLASVAGLAALAGLYASQKLGGVAPAVKPRSPLDWGLAARSAAAYLAITLIGKALLAVAEGYRAGVAVALAVAAIGGLVNATAAILGMASIAGETGPTPATAGMLVAIAAATLNKALYARAAGAPSWAARSVTLPALTLSLPPLAAALILILQP